MIFIFKPKSTRNERIIFFVFLWMNFIFTLFSPNFLWNELHGRLFFFSFLKLA